MDNCSKFSPKKPYPLMHPDRGTCKGCNYGKNGKWGENCPLKTIKEPPEPKERIENRELILSYIPAVMQDEEGNLVNRNIPVTVTVPQKAIFTKIGDGYGNYIWHLKDWMPLQEITDKEKEIAIDETIEKIKKQGGKIL